MINESHTRNFNLVSDKHYYCADTEIEIHILRCLNVARKFGAAKYAETWCAGRESNPLARFARTRRLSAPPPQVRSLLRGLGKTGG